MKQNSKSPTLTAQFTNRQAALHEISFQKARTHIETITILTNRKNVSSVFDRQPVTGQGRSVSQPSNISTGSCLFDRCDPPYERKMYAFQMNG
jgi:hypothetical protein